MSSPQRHVIGRIVLEVETRQSMLAWEIQEELSHLLQQRAIPGMEQLFDQWIGSDEIVRLDELVIDLPPVDPQRLSEEFVPQLLAALKRALDNLPRPSFRDRARMQAGDLTSAESPPDLLTQTTEAADWEALLYFLEYGRLPWWQPSEPLSAWVARWEAVIQQDADWRSGLQRLLMGQPLARQRWVEQLPEPFQRLLILQMQPTWTAFQELLEDAKKLMQSLHLDASTVQYLEQRAWLVLLAQIQPNTSAATPFPARSWLESWLAELVVVLNAMPWREQFPQPASDRSSSPTEVSAAEIPDSSLSSVSEPYRSLRNLIVTTAISNQSLWLTAIDGLAGSRFAGSQSIEAQPTERQVGTETEAQTIQDTEIAPRQFVEDQKVSSSNPETQVTNTFGTTIETVEIQNRDRIDTQPADMLNSEQTEAQDVAVRPEEVLNRSELQNVSDTQEDATADSGSAETIRRRAEENEADRAAESDLSEVIVEPDSLSPVRVATDLSEASTLGTSAVSDEPIPADRFVGSETRPESSSLPRSDAPVTDDAAVLADRLASEQAIPPTASSESVAATQLDSPAEAIITNQPDAAPETLSTEVTSEAAALSESSSPDRSIPSQNPTVKLTNTSTQSSQLTLTDSSQSVNPDRSESESIADFSETGALPDQSSPAVRTAESNLSEVIVEPDLLSPDYVAADLSEAPALGTSAVSDEPIPADRLISSQSNPSEAGIDATLPVPGTGVTDVTPSLSSSAASPSSETPTDILEAITPLDSPSSQALTDAVEPFSELAVPSASASSQTPSRQPANSSDSEPNPLRLEPDRPEPPRDRSAAPPSLEPSSNISPDLVTDIATPAPALSPSAPATAPEQSATTPSDSGSDFPASSTTESSTPPIGLSTEPSTLKNPDSSSPLADPTVVSPSSDRPSPLAIPAPFASDSSESTAEISDAAVADTAGTSVDGAGEDPASADRFISSESNPDESEIDVTPPAPVIDTTVPLPSLTQPVSLETPGDISNDITSVDSPSSQASTDAVEPFSDLAVPPASGSTQPASADQPANLSDDSASTSEATAPPTVTEAEPELQQTHPLMAKPAKQALLPSLSRSERANGIYLNCAGLVLLHPFLPIYFEDVGLVNENQFCHEYAQQQAIGLLYYLATKETRVPEYELVLPKLLCNWPLDEPLLSNLELPEAALAEAEKMLQAVIDYWEVLKSTSPDGLREGFLQRQGKLTRTDNWKLRVEQQAIDILLGRLPWGLSMVKLPWMQEILVVEWS